ncbi:hypothetical protein Q669_29530 [Labrenzia sp. C1B10]|nr:hypothetical protein Q669_29530 [Labrenzia sp. C1B10]ERS05778.1 hypothetical protein Q675_29095 [Labrenzia sp. C1B70]
MSVNIKLLRRKKLSFVNGREAGAVNYWNVCSTGDWTNDTQMGARYYNDLKEYIRETSDALVVRSILPALFAVADKTGVEIGFLDALGSDIGS